jgi:hypothetical protein
VYIERDHTRVMQVFHGMLGTPRDVRERLWPRRVAHVPHYLGGLPGMGFAGDSLGTPRGFLSECCGRVLIR